ncbi:MULTISPECIES: hypothetical protein [unclassified Cryobacterium]|uniref:hypothetical protein n=1 Tax=unclassified Cryobacterium TaxID=2649013 RepID=UPI002AB3E070|nr:MULTISPECIES: hypothetical protein [unclassified Cryobacterium]MDY7541557.1 hypothetical protein [Cryobacterium sp. 5B3]MEA9998030.1 hypothetical protein [Cryobacterium sp. RTS3]MEB0267996.1 hypothetical protein [Cryobacterium sp. 10I5]MEB0274573.1 hypothetical protein [Cryobacterium sp. 5B3]
MAQWVEPRVNLIPPEVMQSRRQTAVAQRLSIALLLVVVGVAVAVAAALLFATTAQTRLQDEQNRTSSIAQQELIYAPVRVVQSRTALTRAAQYVGGATEIDWKGFLERVATVTPPNTKLTTLTIDSVSPLTTYEVSANPLTKPSVAGVTLDAASASVSDASSWIAGLGAVSGVSDVQVGSITQATEGGSYLTTVTLHLDPTAFDKRFAPKEGE